MSSVLQLPVSLMLQLFAEVPSCLGALLVCLFSGFPGCSWGSPAQAQDPVAVVVSVFLLAGIPRL